MAGRKGKAALVLAAAITAGAGGASAETVDWIAYRGGTHAVLLAPRDFPPPGQTCLPYDACWHAILYCTDGAVDIEIGYMHANDVIAGWRTTMGPMATITIDGATATLGLDGMVIVARDNWRARLLPDTSGTLLAALPGAQTFAITAPLYDVSTTLSDADRTIPAGFAASCSPA